MKMQLDETKYQATWVMATYMDSADMKEQSQWADAVNQVMVDDRILPSIKKFVMDRLNDTYTEWVRQAYKAVQEGDYKDALFNMQNAEQWYNAMEYIKNMPEYQENA